MERIIFADSWESILAEQGLKSFKDFFRYRGGKSVNKNKNRDVLLLRLKIDNQERNFYLKRFRYPYFKDILFTLMNCWEICSQAAYEWKNINLLKKNNIGTSNPVCFGEKLRFGIERKSFIVTEEIKGQCLTDFIAQNWGKLPQSEKEEIITSLAKTIRRIHKTGISMPDLYVWHIFMSENKDTDGNDKYNFAFIDLNRMKSKNNKNEKIKNLGRLHYSMTDKYFDKPMRELLIKAYIGKESDKKTEEFIRRIVKKYSKKKSARRNPQSY